MYKFGNNLENIYYVDFQQPNNQTNQTKPTKPTNNKYGRVIYKHQQLCRAWCLHQDTQRQQETKKKANNIHRESFIRIDAQLDFFCGLNDRRL
jgi:hypothetical protein